MLCNKNKIIESEAVTADIFKLAELPVINNNY